MPCYEAEKQANTRAHRSMTWEMPPFKVVNSNKGRLHTTEAVPANTLPRAYDGKRHMKLQLVETVTKRLSSRP